MRRESGAGSPFLQFSLGGSGVGRLLPLEALPVSPSESLCTTMDVCADPPVLGWALHYSYEGVLQRANPSSAE